jgi:hypothetical protein
MRLMRSVLFALLGSVILTACAAPSGPSPAQQQGPEVASQAAPVMTVYRSPSCGCCSDWVDYVEQHGYHVEVQDVQNPALVKAEHGIPLPLQSCHTAVIDGYVIEGHVPVDSIERLLAERPAVVGIAVPGMPIGSPGMEVAGTAPEPFEVVTFDAAGATTVFARYPQ